MRANQTPLRVLQVVLSLQTGGLERLVLDLLRMGPRFGLRQSVAALVEAGDLADRLPGLNAPLAVLHKRPGLDFSLVPALVRVIKAQSVDVIHAHNPGAAFWAGLAGAAARRPLVTTVHGAAFGMDRSYHWVTRLSALMSRRLVCVGRDARQTLRRVDKIPAGRLRVFYNGVDLERFAPDPEAGLAARAALGLAPDDFVVISVSRLSPEKDCGSLFAALKLLAADHPEARLLLAGDGPEMENYQRTAREMGLGDRVLFLGSREDVPDLLRASDAFALASLSEGVSLAVLEAMAAGLPAAITRVGGAPEIVHPGRTGFLVEPGRPEELARALGRLAKNLDLAQRLGRAGRKLVRERFSLEAMAGGYAELYRSVARR